MVHTDAGQSDFDLGLRWTSSSRSRSQQRRAFVMAKEVVSTCPALRRWLFFELWSDLVQPVRTPCSRSTWPFLFARFNRTPLFLEFQVCTQQLARKKPGDDLQVLLVFKRMDTVKRGSLPVGCTDSSDSLVRHPNGLAVTVNGTLCDGTSSAATCNGPPLDITKHCHLTPGEVNRLTIEQTELTVGAFEVSVHLGRKRPPCEVAEQIRSKSPCDGKQLIEKMWKSAKSSSDVTLSFGSMVLTCPLSAARLVHPGRTRFCSHIQCFDIIAYLKLNEGRAKWLCPICKKPTTVEDLFIDSFVAEIIHSTPEEVDRVEFYPDGSWKAVETSRGIRRGQKRRAQSADISSDAQLESSAKRVRRGRHMMPRVPVIDLTVNDSISASQIGGSQSIVLN